MSVIYFHGEKLNSVIISIAFLNIVISVFLIVALTICPCRLLDCCLLYKSNWKCKGFKIKCSFEFFCGIHWTFWISSLKKNCKFCDLKNQLVKTTFLIFIRLCRQNNQNSSFYNKKLSNIIIIKIEHIKKYILNVLLVSQIE